MNGGEDAAQALERRYRWLLAWYPPGYRAANSDELLGVALARSAEGQRWPEPGEAVSLAVSGAGERFAGMLRRPDQRDAAAVLAVAGPLLLAVSPFLFLPALSVLLGSPRMLVAAAAITVWWTLVALAGMLGWRRAVAAATCLGLAGQVAVLTFHVFSYGGALMPSYWQAALALVIAVAALGSVRGQGQPLRWRAAAALAATVVVLASFVTVADPGSGIGSWLLDGLFAVPLILVVTAVVAMRPPVRRRAAVLLLPVFLITALSCGAYRGLAPSGLLFDTFWLSPLQWQDLLLAPVIGVAAGFTGLRVREGRRCSR